MAAKIFLCYRRKDTAGWCHAIRCKLDFKFGPEKTFQDITGIQAGEVFPSAISQSIDQCAVVFVLMGKHWLSLTQEKQSDPEEKDHVIFEIQEALGKGIPVYPVLLDNMEMPKTSELPEDIRELASIRGLPIYETSFNADIMELIKIAKKELNRRKQHDINLLWIFINRILDSFSLYPPVLWLGILCYIIFLGLMILKSESLSPGHFIFYLPGAILFLGALIHRRYPIRLWIFTLIVAIVQTILAVLMGPLNDDFLMGPFVTAWILFLWYLVAIFAHLFSDWIRSVLKAPKKPDSKSE